MQCFGVSRVLSCYLRFQLSHATPDPRFGGVDVALLRGCFVGVTDPLLYNFCRNSISCKFVARPRTKSMPAIPLHPFSLAEGDVVALQVVHPSAQRPVLQDSSMVHIVWMVRAAQRPRPAGLVLPLWSKLLLDSHHFRMTVSLIL